MNDDWHFTRPRAGDVQEAAPEQKENPPAGDSDRAWETILSAGSIRAAWERVRLQAGAPGVDGVTVHDLAETFPWEWGRIHDALHAGTWTPSPVRRVSIPKPDGGCRMLGIPTVLDRVLHLAVAQELTPRWEPCFSPRSFGFRKGRGARQALDCLAVEAGRLGDPLAWHLDIRDFFDSVPRPQALRAVRRVCQDERLLRTVAAILDAGAQSGTAWMPTPRGLPQGSPLSPLLANAVLHPLDLWMAEQGLPFIRYADDIVILLSCRRQFAECRHFIMEKLGLLSLELNPAKCALTPLPEACILGFSLYQDRGVWRRRIAGQSWESFERECRHRGTWSHAFAGEERQGTAQDYARGWAAYFSLTECPHDQARLAEMRNRTSSWPSAATVRMDYNGHAGRTSGGSGPSSHEKEDSSTPAPRPQRARPASGPAPWRFWLVRLLTRRWIGIGFDFGRGARALRLRIGPLSFRFRL